MRKEETMSTVKVKPSKTLSAGSVVMLIFMLLFGIGFAVFSIIDVFDSDELSLKILVPLFFTVFIGAIVFILVYHVMNLKGSKGLSMIDIDTESGFPTGETERDPIKRLRDLEALKKDGLISSEEYSRKRTEIMEKKW
ncbi:MAG: SHOCT domain-containing protein [Nitrospiraceae bacterium]|nr:MAG: SHOCT domain-containing protein [Nitrospiraceae bacterium]